MRIPTYLAMALVPAALVAQTAAMPDYTALQKAQAPAIDELLKEFQPDEALKKAESLLPASLPAFDKSSPSASLKCSISMSGLTRLYLIAAKAAVQDGDWEKGLEHFTQAQACSKENYEGTTAAVTPVIANWTDAVEKAKKYVADHQDEINAIKAKPGRTPEEEKEYQEFLAKENVYNTTKNSAEKNDAAKWLNSKLAHVREIEAKAINPAEQAQLDQFKIAQGNLANGPKTIKALQENIDATKAEADNCAQKVEAAQKSLKDEEAETTKGLEEFKVKGKLVKETSGPKFEEKKAKYFESILKTKANYESRPAKMDKMNFLYRLRHKVAGTPLESNVSEVIDRVRQDQDPLPPEKKAGKHKKGK